MSSFQNFYKCPNCNTTWNEYSDQNSQADCYMCKLTNINPIKSLNHETQKHNILFEMYLTENKKREEKVDYQTWLEELAYSELGFLE